MNSTLRVSVCALAALALGVAGATACSDSNEANAPGGQSATGGSDSTEATGGSDSTDATGGSDSTDGSGGATTDATGGATTGTGGATSDATGGAAGAFECNYPTASDPPPDGVAACTDDVKKNAACADVGVSEGDMCYRSCGPRNSSGWKTETCTGGIIVEVSACEWTGTDYSAFRVPANYPPTAEDLDPACPPAGSPPQATMACEVPACVSCAEPGTGAYLDSGGSTKSGWCTCADDGSGTATWSCGTAGTAWPCPGNDGC